MVQMDEPKRMKALKSASKDKAIIAISDTTLQKSDRF